MANLNELKQLIAKKKKIKNKKDGTEKYKDYPFNVSQDDSGESASGESAGLDAEAKKGRCWEGYEPTPGKKPYSPGSCQKKKASLNLKELKGKINV